MHVETFTFATMHLYGELFYSALKLRKSVFVDKLGWDIPHDKSVEFDQYDRPDTSYVVAHVDGKILGTVRLIPTTTTWGSANCMINDAIAGKLDGIPTWIMPSTISREDIFEASRIVVRECGIRQQLRTLEALFDAAMKELTRRGGRYIISINQLAMIPTLKRYGLSSEQIGRRVVYHKRAHSVLLTRYPTVEFPVDISRCTEPQSIKVAA